MKVEKFLDLVCEALGVPANSLTLDDSPQTVPQWDSLGHLVIIATMERDLGVAPHDASLHNFTSIRQLVERLKALHALED